MFFNKDVIEQRLDKIEKRLDELHLSEIQIRKQLEKGQETVSVDLVNQLNGGLGQRYKQDLQEIVEDICASLETIAKIMKDRY